METIPNHELDLFKSDQVIVEKLGHLGSYDFGIPHRHNYFELFYFQKGAGSHMIDFEDFNIDSNSIHLVAPNQVHQVKRELETNGFVVLFDLDSLKAQKEVEDFLFDFVCYHPLELNPIFNQIDSDLLTFIFERVAKAKETKGNHSTLEINQSIQLLLIECMKHLNADKKGIDSDYVAFRKLLMLNFKEWHKVKEYALEIGITERTLNEIVKNQTGKTSSQLIYDQLILEAKRLLHTNLSVKETSFQLHFEDPSHFSKFFKNQTGLSPKDFQKVHA
jgi:AraC-like DNA-binding protein/mannose-6-phosphate isomerase-like protein (cupin superfamily)